MKITLRRLSVLAFVILVAGLVSAFPQMCGKWTVSIELIDGSGRPIENATISFIDVPEGDAATKRPFERSEAAQNIYVATFIEGDRFSKEYKLLITSPGFLDFNATTRIDYCRKTLEKIVLVRPPTLTGTILDTNGAIIVGAKVTAVQKDGKKWEALVTEDGHYSLRLPASTFDITASKEWFCPMVFQKYRVVNSTFGKMNLDFVLDVASSHLPCEKK